MATGRNQGLCAMLKRFIDATKKEIKRKEDRVSNQQSLLQKLTGQPNADSALIKQIRDDIAQLQGELEQDRSQLIVLEEEFSAECGGS